MYNRLVTRCIECVHVINTEIRDRKVETSTSGFSAALYVHIIVASHMDDVYSIYKLESRLKTRS